MAPALKSSKEIVAKIGNETIFNKELEQGIEVELFELEEKIFNLKMDRLKVIMLEKFMKLHPKKLGLPTMSFLKSILPKTLNLLSQILLSL